MPAAITREILPGPRRTPPPLWSWQAGSRTGITDDRQRAFSLAGQYAPDSPDSTATVSLVTWMPSLTRVTGWYWTRLTWTARATPAGIEWSGEREDETQ